MTNFVIIMTDTQNKSMIGAYGNPAVDTPNLDRLAATGTRFDRAYTTCPLCTPARSAIFTGRHPQVNGAWANNMAPGRNIPMMGEIFRHYGFDVAYTGKWHLDGSGYFGDGIAGGGFPQEWWYDGKCYLEEIGPEQARAYRRCRTADHLRQARFTEDRIWGHRVADRAIDFMNRKHNRPFLLVASFDEPHGPFVAPPEYWEKFHPDAIPKPDNFYVPLDAKPQLQKIQRGDESPPDWTAYIRNQFRFFGCNRYVDREIGRILDAIDARHADDTIVIYTSDHGDMLGAHGLHSKGPMMYEEITNIPFIVRGPGVTRGCSDVPVSHLDILPTMLDLAGIDIPESLPGVSLAATLQDPDLSPRETAMMSFTRFAINHDDWGEFYPIRAITDGHYKLVINLFDTDEFYDLDVDPGEMRNRIGTSDVSAARDRLHDALLDEMDRIRDPFRSYRWGDRAWRSVRQPFYHGGKRRNRLTGFPFEPDCIEAG